MSKQPINIHIQHLVREIKVECAPGSKFSQAQLQRIENEILGIVIKTLDHYLKEEGPTKDYPKSAFLMNHPDRQAAASRLEHATYEFNSAIKSALRTDIPFDLTQAGTREHPELLFHLNIKYDSQK